MIHSNTHLPKRNEDVDEVDDSFEHTFIKEKWRCKWSRWFIWTHIYQREMRCKLTRWFIWTHIYQGEIKM